MLKNISHFLIIFSKSQVAFTALVIFLLFIFFILPGQSAAAKVYSREVGSPDLSLFYSPQDLYTMAKAYGPIGRNAYVHARFTFDLAFPLIYGGFLLISISWLLSRLVNESSNLLLLNLLPIAAIVFDVLENISASFVIFRYPIPSPIFASLAPFFTLIKWGFVSSSFLILMISALLFPFIKKK